MNTKIKICGLFRPEDIEYANQTCPDFIGFVFWERSRRFVTPKQARRLREKLDGGIRAVGVFVDAPCEEIIRLLQEGVIDIAQLHGGEPEQDIRRIQERTGRPVIRAAKIRERCDVEALLDSPADWILFDGGMGGGVPFDWSLLKGVERDFFLAGGLSPENLGGLLKDIRPYAVDLSSGVEADGVKDLAKMRAAVGIVRESAQIER